MAEYGPIRGLTPALRASRVGLGIGLGVCLGICTALGAGHALAQSGPTQTDPELPWYQVEFVIFVDRTSEDFGGEQLLEAPEAPQFPAGLLALAPPPGVPLRPERVGELAMLWSDVDQAPRWRLVPPGVTVESQEQLERAETAAAEAELRARAAEEAPSAAPATDSSMTPVPAPSITPTVTLGPAAETAPDTAPEPDPIPMDLAFRVVPDSERLLTDEARRIARSSGRSVLAHLAWRQPFEAQAPALPVLVEHVDPFTGERDLVGTVGVDLRRFLHAEALLYHSEQVEVPARPVEQVMATPALDAEGPPDAASMNATAQTPMAAQVPATRTLWIRITQDRRMRSGELHYLDHPRVGILVTTAPWTPADAAEERSGAAP